MACRWFGLAVILSVLPLGAGTIDVSTQTSVLLDTGDALSFTVPSWNFGITAAKFGLAEYPTRVGFIFASVPEGSPGQFEVVLESGDGSVSVSLGAPLSFTTGIFQGAGYSGAVSVLDGSLLLSEALSQQLFGNSAAVLMLLNTGPAVTVGLPPYSLQQDMNVSLGGGGLSVGARLGRVSLMDPPLGGAAPMDASSDPPGVPEPGSGRAATRRRRAALGAREAAPVIACAWRLGSSRARFLQAGCVFARESSETTAVAWPSPRSPIPPAGRQSPCS